MDTAASTMLRYGRNQSGPMPAFAFRGAAIAFAGRITRPSGIILPVCATALPTTGGLAESRLDSTTITDRSGRRPLLAFRDAASELRSLDDTPDGIRATARIKDVNVLDRVQFDSAEITLELVGNTALTLTVVHVAIENLTIDEKRFTIDWNLDALKRDYGLQARGSIVGAVNGHTLHAEEPRFTLANFGTIEVGSYVHRNGSVNLCLLSFRFGSPVEGRVQMGTLELSGDPGTGTY